MKRKKPEDVDATRVSTDASESAGPSETQLFSQAVREAEENADAVNRTTLAAGGDSTGATRIGADSTRILDRPARNLAPEERPSSGGGAILFLLAGATAGAITLVLVTLFSTP